MNNRIGPTNNRCYVCREPVPQPDTGRPRLTCSNACRQARYRFLQGMPSRKLNREKKLVERRRSKPFVERRFDKTFFEPVYELGNRRNVYECLACGRPYLVERLKSGNPVNPYCSKKCEKKAAYHWDKFLDAYERAHQRGELDKRVEERFWFDKLSPLCPHCGNPFPPNTTLHGKRRRGRPRKYCSDACRKAAYEQRWKSHNYGASRKHRYRPCLNCGVKFDCMDTNGRRTKKHCSRQCTSQRSQRRRTARSRLLRRVSLARRSKPARLMPRP